MLPENVCNFLATLAHPPWTQAVRHDLHMTIEGEKRILFSSHVQRSSATTSSLYPPTLFLHFNALPDELQVHILTCCSAQTLFQLMKVSSALRTEASKLFWANPEVYFLVEARWLLGGGYPGDTHSDLAFLAYAQNIQVDYSVGTENKICPLRDDRVEVRQDLITHFWESLIKRCPRAKKVIVNQCWISALLREEKECVPKALQLLIRASPPGITASAFIVEARDPNPLDTGLTTSSAQKWQRAVYQLCADGTWEKAKSGQDWDTVLAPVKQFSGPVGRFQQLLHRGLLLVLQEDGLWPVVVEALDRYHFHDGNGRPFSCPVTGCDGYFQKAGEWTIHAAELHCQEWRSGDRFRILPQEARDEWKDYARILAEKTEKIWQDARNMHTEWEDGGKEGQRKIEKTWIQQLESDQAWETGEEAVKSKLWNEFWQEMNSTI